MRKLEHENPYQDEVVTRRALWVVLFGTLIHLFIVALSIRLIIQNPNPPLASWIVLGASILVLAVSIYALVITWRKKVKTGLNLSYYTYFVIVFFITFFYEGRSMSAGSALGLVALIIIMWVFPPEERRRPIISLIVFMVYLIVWEVISPAFREPLTSVSTETGIILGILFALAVVVLVARQAWGSVRTRIFAFTLGLTLASIAVVAFITVNALLSSGQRAQEASAAALRNQVEDYLLRLTLDSASQNDLILDSISQDAMNVAILAAQIFENPEAYRRESYWNADAYMFFGEENQYINGEEDVSTVFVPNTVTVDDAFKEKLELAAYLDRIFVPVYESDPNTVAIYYIGKEEFSRLYPNVNLGSFLPPDYLATQDIFFSIGTPENNPGREVVWTPVYDDPAGQGLLVSAIAPIYTPSDGFIGVVGIDVSLAGLTNRIESQELITGGYALLVDSQGRALALPEQGYEDILGRQRNPNEFGPDLGDARSEFVPFIAEMMANESGFESLVIGDHEYLLSYAQLESTDWRVASVADAEVLLAPAITLQSELDTLSQTLISRQILPAGFVLVLLVLVVGIFFTNRLVQPLQQLSESAVKIGAGEWDTPLPESDMEEIGTLSSSLGDMAGQLKEFVGSLEQQVADRTRALATSTEVSRRLSTILDQQQLVREVVDQLRFSFGYYHAQIYLYDRDKQNLVMVGGTGDAGRTMLAREHKIQKGQGLVGQAAERNEVVLIRDVSQAEGWLPNPLLPDTQSEVAVPIAVGSDVMGVLDIQHNVVGGISEEDSELILAIANQVAIAVQNAQAYTRAQRQAVREAQIASINQRIQAANSIEEVLKIAASELGRTMGSRATVEIKAMDPARDRE